jgi:CheY-like chemotaxis protein
MIAVPIGTILNECCSLLAPLASEEQVKIINNYHSMEQAIVRADPIRLKQIIVNLISNAIKYNLEGGTVEINCIINETNNVLVEVINTGFGIPEDQLDKLFKPFSRLEIHQEKEGTGIGLMLSKNLIELMEGKIGFESTLNKETRFWIELVPENIEVEAKNTETFQLNTLINEANIQTKCTVLYVEDNLTNFKLVKEIFIRRPNIKLLHTKTAEAGLEMVRTYSIDIILMDLQLPGMNGVEGLQAIREETNQQKIPAIAISAQSMLDENQQAIDAGFEDYISKPIDVMQFLDKIDSIIERTLS